MSGPDEKQAAIDELVEALQSYLDFKDKYKRSWDNQYITDDLMLELEYKSLIAKYGVPKE